MAAAVGDARSLPVGEGAADATLCLGGPLSHVLDAAGRVDPDRDETELLDRFGRETVALLREDRSVVDLSGHMLAVCRA